MEAEQWILAVINIIGGIAVLGSYVWGIRSHPETKAEAWGQVPQNLKPFYVVSMGLAAAGYISFAYFILFEVDPAEIEILGGAGFSVFYAICALILVPSALWMPLTFSMIDKPAKMKWYSVRVVLWLVGIAALVLFAALITLRPGDSGVSYLAATTGAGFFCIQTAVLDAIIWPAYFPKGR